MDDQHSVIVGVGLKMYMSHKDTMEWINLVRGIAKSHPAVTAGVVELFVLPSFTAVIPSVFALRDARVAIGAQDLFWEDRGAFTGEVSGRDLAEIGCTLVEVGHAERRRVLGESESIVSQKMLAAFRNSLTPVLCIGEPERASAADAAARPPSSSLPMSHSGQSALPSLPPRSSSAKLSAFSASKSTAIPYCAAPASFTAEAPARSNSKR